MSDIKEKYPSLFNLDEGDINLFEQELKQYILDLSGEFIYEFWRGNLISDKYLLSLRSYSRM